MSAPMPALTTFAVEAERRQWRADLGFAISEVTEATVRRLTVTADPDVALRVVLAAILTDPAVIDALTRAQRWRVAQAELLTGPMTLGRAG